MAIRAHDKGTNAREWSWPAKTKLLQLLQQARAVNLREDSDDGDNDDGGGDDDEAIEWYGRTTTRSTFC